MKPLVQVPAADVAGVTQALRGGARRRAGRAADRRRRRVPDDGVPARVVDDASPSSSRRAGRRMPRSASLSPPTRCARAPPRREAALGGPGSGCSRCPRTTSRGAGARPLDRRGHRARRARAASTSTRSRSPRHPPGSTGAMPTYTSLVPAQLARLVDAARTDRSGRRRPALVRPDPRRRAGAPPPSLDRAADTRACASPAPTGRARRPAAASTTGGRSTASRCASSTARCELVGPMLADGYLGDPERTAARVHDRRRRHALVPHRRPGALDDDGALRITGRADDVIISGGVKVSLGDGRAGRAGGPGLRRRRGGARRRTPSGASVRRWSRRARMPPRHPTPSRPSPRRPTPRGSRPPRVPCASSSWSASRCWRRASPTGSPSRSSSRQP